MLYNLLYPLSYKFPLLNLFKYITFRAGGAILTSLLISFLIGPWLIAKMKVLQKKGQPIREEGPQNHLLTKKGTPTMGGVLILFASISSTLLWCNLKNAYIWIILFVTVSHGVLGFLDDYFKVTKYNTKGVKGKVKLLCQMIIAFIACYFIQNLSMPIYQSKLTVPFFKEILINLGNFYFVFAMLVIIGASNAVNLTDGLDGLAIIPVIVVAACFALICYLIGNIVFANYLQIHHIKDTGEISIFCGSLIGAGLGFLWFNAPPARIFMGDTGSLALGASLGVISIIVKHELVLAIIGGLFVIEALSVIIQVYYFKFTGGKRVFLMAPIHHHFEKKGWSEATVVIRFWIISFIFAIIGLATLKLR
jgi:phospho-N-acetylmuramoyl-pentapeptide-transferase